MFICRMLAVVCSCCNTDVRRPTYVLPLLLHETDTWSITKKDQLRLNAFGWKGVETRKCVTQRKKELPSPVVTQFLKAEGDKLSKNAKISRRYALDIATEGASTSAAFSIDLKQRTITSVFDKQKTLEAGEAVARMCNSTDVTFNIVYNQHLREICMKIGQFGASYQVTSDFPIRKTLLDKKYARVSLRVDECHGQHLNVPVGKIVCYG